MSTKVERREFLALVGSTFGGVGLASIAETVEVWAETKEQESGDQKERKMTANYLVRRISEVPKEKRPWVRSKP